MRPALALAGLSLVLATPAHAEEPPKTPRLEYVWQALNVIDTIQTIDCMRREVCHEANSLIGRNPSHGKLIAYKAAAGLLHFIIARELQHLDPKAARVFEIGTIVAQGGVVAINMRMCF